MSLNTTEMTSVLYILQMEGLRYDTGSEFWCSPVTKLLTNRKIDTECAIVTEDHPLAV